MVFICTKFIKTTKMDELQQGVFGPIFTQFEGKPKEAMTHLCNVKDGECPKAFYREDVGFVDFVWGKPNEKSTDKGGFGLSHILIDHGNEIRDFNIDPIDFILMIMNFGKLNTEGKKNRIYLEGQEFRLIVTTEWYGKSKQLLLTAFDLRPISRKKPAAGKRNEKSP